MNRKWLLKKLFKCLIKIFLKDPKVLVHKKITKTINLRKAHLIWLQILNRKFALCLVKIISRYSNVSTQTCLMNSCISMISRQGNLATCPKGKSGCSFKDWSWSSASMISRSNLVIKLSSLKANQKYNRSKRNFSTSIQI